MDKKCEAPGKNHSNDLLTVYVGKAKPVVRCGYHQYTNTAWKDKRNG